MIKVNGDIIDINKFPDGALLLKRNLAYDFSGCRNMEIEWLFENNEEFVALIYLVKHMRSHGIDSIDLKMPYIPNARQDRVKNEEDVFTLKYFAEIINDLQFNSVAVLDPHSSVSEALINRIIVKTPNNLIRNVILKVEKDNDQILMFYPDEGAMKRYSGLSGRPYAFGIKKRNWETGEIQGLDVSGRVDLINGSKVIIVDDISSRGGTFYYSARKLKELGAKEIYLYVSHCENTILEGEVLTSSLIEKVFTTNSIFTKQHERIEVMNYDKENEPYVID